MKNRKSDRLLGWLRTAASKLAHQHKTQAVAALPIGLALARGLLLRLFYSSIPLTLGVRYEPTWGGDARSVDLNENISRTV